MSCNISACKSSARSSCSIFSGSESISNWYGNIDAILNYTGADWTCCFGKGRGSTETPSKLFANHNALGQLTNHNTFCFSEGGSSSNPELIEPFVPGWGERCCNNVNYVKNNTFFESPSMRACSSTPPKQNQDFVKEHNRTPLILYSFVSLFFVTCFIWYMLSRHTVWLIFSVTHFIPIMGYCRLLLY